MNKKQRYLDDIAALGLTEKEFIALPDKAKIFVIFKLPPLATYKSLSLAQRQRRFKDYTLQLYARLTKRYHLSRCLEFPSKDGAIMQFTAFVPPVEVGRIVAEAGVSHLFVTKVGRRQRRGSGRVRLYSVAAYSQMWLEGGTKPVRFEEALFMVSAKTEMQAIKKIKVHLKFREPPCIDPVFDPEYRIIEWRVQDVVVVDRHYVVAAPGTVICAFERTSKRPLKKVFNVGR